MYLEVIATILGLIQGVLVMLNKKSNWIFYILQLLFLIIFSYINHLYGDVLNNAIYLIFGFIGYYLWNKDKKTNSISKTKIEEKFIYITLIVFSTIVFDLILKKTDDPLPLLDSFTTVTSLVATFYMVKKKIDTWIIWFINDVFYAIEYFLLPNQAIYLLILNALWAFLAVASFVNWNKIMKEGNDMKKIYFAGKFSKTNKKNAKLSDRLKNDYRSILLGDSKKLTYAQKDLKLNENIIYSGPFYCEAASSGCFTSTDCKTVLEEEYKSVKESDIYLVVFDDEFSAGSIVELGWALEMNKDIIIFYKTKEDSEYDIKSEYWFPITNAIRKNKKVKLYKYKEIKEVIKKIEEGEIFLGGELNEV